ncbi:glucose 1-dehydrogenase [Sneathiella sp. P13V-1]|uniref:SDR family NAD(P)-dependent oxidoreductase n=1 Tax=Sneathiella sp. P13V-1 TaxID=2697366 RepID=UPI00187B8783|nr:glucose 1-dehydrogenase [Sneathiella sp. P13V-1]MBE7636844.1 glucose 1-dehydrogenase [Sneathiella sp. P13V-1]
MSDKKVAIVTGSATGTGAAIAIALAEKGYNVLINYTKSKSEAEETAKTAADKGADVVLFQGDVSKDEDCRAMVEAAVQKWGRIDALINNAGRTKFVPHGDLDGLDAQDFQDIYAVNTIGPFQMTRACAPHLKASGAGRVVMISSVAGTHGHGSSLAYVASKGGLNSMTKGLARALGPEITVNAICPGMIETRWLREGWGEENYEQNRQAMMRKVPLATVSQPEDIADAVLWFVLGTAPVTGELLMVDGGMHLVS